MSFALNVARGMLIAASGTAAIGCFAAAWSILAGTWQPGAPAIIAAVCVVGAWVSFGYLFAVWTTRP